MQEQITQRTLARLDPEGTGKRYFVRGSNPVGWGIEVSAKGKASYFIETRVTGRRSATRKKIGSVDIILLSDAQAEAKAFLGNSAKGVDIRYSAAEEDKPPKQLVMDLRCTLTRSATHWGQALPTTTRKHLIIFSDWRTLPLQQLTKQRVKDRCLELRGTGKTSDYVNKAFKDLSSTLSYYDVEPNPIRVLKQKGLRQAGKARKRFLDQEEVVHIMEHHSTVSIHGPNKTQAPKITRILLFLMLTGLRKAEALGLRWRDIQGGFFTIYFDMTKTLKLIKCLL